MKNIFTLSLVAVCMVIGYGCTKKEEQKAETAATGAAMIQKTAPAQTEGLMIKDLTYGKGAEATLGKTVVVHYTGTLKDGTKFDSSLDRNKPFSFPLGAGAVIQGWEKGIVGMKVGGKRKLIIPPNLGYGERGAGGVIPPNATLLFDVELLEVK